MNSMLVLLWLTLLLALGWLMLPLSLFLWSARDGESDSVLGSLPDAGLAAGRMLLLVMWTLAAFWLGNAGIAVKWAVLAVFPLVGIIWCPMRSKATKGRLRRVIESNWRGMLAVEASFLVVFLFFFVLRGYWPGTGDDEKPMDMALISSCLRADALPPADSYAAGQRLQNYYYLGHLQTALLTRFIGSQPRWTYNLMCATVPALCFSILVSLGMALVKNRRGVLAALCVLSLGTLSPLQQWGDMPRGSPVPRFWPVNHDATRAVIPYTITEYPWSAFQMSVLHAHLFAIPLSLLFMALCWALLRGTFSSSGAKNDERLTLICCGLTLGAVIVTNTWDFPGHWLLLLLGLGVAAVARKEAGKWVLDAARVLAKASLAACFALIVAAPFLLHLENATSRGLVEQPASPARAWLLVWALPIIAWLMALWLVQTRVFEAQSESRATRFFSWMKTAAALCATVWGGLFLLTGQNHLVIALLLFLIVASGLSGWQSAHQSAASTRDEKQRSTLLRHAFLCCLAISGWSCLLASEVVWSGFLGPPVHRINNVMKWGLQAWLLVGTAAACSAFGSLGASRTQDENAPHPTGEKREAGKKSSAPVASAAVAPRRYAMQWRAWPLLVRLSVLALLALLPASLCASAAMMCGRTRYFSNFEGWDAWSHLAPDERIAAQWLTDHARDGDFLIEASDERGGDYTEYPRYANATGVPAVVGPRSHTFQWGTPWAQVDERRAAVREFYTTYNAARQREILRFYRVKYIVCGDLERRQYGELAISNVEGRFAHLREAGDGDQRVVICAAEE